MKKLIGKKQRPVMLLCMAAVFSSMTMVSCGGDDDVITPAPANGHEYVDLGLSVKWATCNVGANNPWETGDYFAWGETAPKETYTRENYKFATILTDGKYATINSSAYPWIDTEEHSVTHTDVDIFCYLTLNPEHDAAAVNWGGNWRMPTLTEIEELYSNCYFKWTDDYMGSGKGGYIVFKVKNEADKGIYHAKDFEKQKERHDDGNPTREPVAVYDIQNDTHIFIPEMLLSLSLSTDKASYECAFWTSSLWTSYTSYGRFQDYSDSALPISLQAKSTHRDWEETIPYRNAPVRAVLH